MWWVVEDLVVLAVVVALGWWGVSSWRAASAGRIVAPRCPACGGLVSRADRRCRHCRATLAG